MRAPLPLAWRARNRVGRTYRRAVALAKTPKDVGGISCRGNSGVLWNEGRRYDAPEPGDGDRQAWSAATPGNCLPSIHSRNAPPAVETKVKSSFTLA